MNDQSFFTIPITLKNEPSLAVRLSITYGPRVELGFPDGRKIDMTIHEWIAVGVFAIESAAFSQELATAFQRHTIRGALAVLEKPLARIMEEIKELRKAGQE
jgi:hypothetical protein